MEKIITGYQYGDENQFIGEYKFENNLDKETIHLPPRTVLVAPPEITEGMRAIWNGKKWSLEEDPYIKAEKERIEALEKMMEEQRQAELAAQLAIQQATQNTAVQLPSA